MIKLTADFETTTDPNDCRVWAWAVCHIYDTNRIEIGNTIDSFIDYLFQGETKRVYFHNLKFDGNFIISWLENNGFMHSTAKNPPCEKTYTTLIADNGLFYNMIVLYNNVYVEFMDSLKLLPFSVAQVAKGFDLPISKLEINYEEYREPGHILTPLEENYIKHDVLIMAMALRIMFQSGLTKLTIGGNAIAELREVVGKKHFDYLFPRDVDDASIRKAYRGGFTYLKPEYADKDLGEGLVLDVNSLYPSVMKNRPYPFGKGVFFKGKYKNNSRFPLFVQAFSCVFELKPGHIPTIQLKNNYYFGATEYLTSSKGVECELCLTSVDLKIFLEHYNVKCLTYHCGYMFPAIRDVFSPFIEKWTAEKIKAKEEGNKAKYTIAKLIQNSSYGKFGTRPDVRNMQPYLDEEGVVRFRFLEKSEKQTLYIPVGVFVTAWARDVTIRSAQRLYDRFIYSDTDSLHILGKEIPEGIEISDTALGAWKIENTFDRARFIRAKTYIEETNGKLNVTACGMPANCHDQVTWENFHPGAIYTGKLMPKYVKGGIVLQKSDFTIRI